MDVNFDFSTRTNIEFSVDHRSQKFKLAKSFFACCSLKERSEIFRAALRRPSEKLIRQITRDPRGIRR